MAKKIERLLIYTDERRYKDEVLRGGTIIGHLNELKKQWDRLEISEPFETAADGLIREGVGYAAAAYREHQEKMLAKLGVTDPKMKANILSGVEGMVQPLDKYVPALRRAIEGGSMQHSFNMAFIRIGPDGADLLKDAMLEAYRTYIETPEEHALHSKLETLQHAFNAFQEELQTIGFPARGAASLDDFYDEGEGNKLSIKADMIRFALGYKRRMQAYNKPQVRETYKAIPTVPPVKGVDVYQLNKRPAGL